MRSLKYKTYHRRNIVASTIIQKTPKSPKIHNTIHKIQVHVSYQHVIISLSENQAKCELSVAREKKTKQKQKLYCIFHVSHLITSWSNLQSVCRNCCFNISIVQISLKCNIIHILFAMDGDTPKYNKR